MSWTSFMRRLQVGARLRIVNVRRAWLSREVEIIKRSKRSVIMQDDEGKYSKLELPAASFTKMDGETAILLAPEDGPLFHPETRRPAGEILAGQPCLTVTVVEDAP